MYSFAGNVFWKTSPAKVSEVVNVFQSELKDSSSTGNNHKD